jgi:HK97 family phage major capsid protein
MQDLALAFDEFMRAFEAFKAANDERLAQIEQSISEDVVTIEKLERINRALDQHQAAMDQLTLKGARPPLGGSAIRLSGSLLQHKAAFEAYVRHGEANGLHLLEQKALSVGSGQDGAISCRPRPRLR